MFPASAGRFLLSGPPKMSQEVVFVSFLVLPRLRAGKPAANGPPRAVRGPVLPWVFTSRFFCASSSPTSFLSTLPFISGTD